MRGWLDMQGSTVTRTDMGDNCVAVQVGDPLEPGLLCSAPSWFLDKWGQRSTFWWIWRKQGGALRLVFTVRQTSYWIATRVELLPGGVEVRVRTPRCLVLREAYSKGRKMPAGATESIEEVCAAAGIWKWEKGRFRKQPKSARPTGRRVSAPPTAPM